ncbi:MAG: carotenoid 1,2-hydratase, partial [bacterium]|nr:carotenoid 1,2-hydratase [bacterium]
AAEFEIARPGYRYEFPRDHFNHPRFQTEWWYYTGNLHTTEGRRFGFELTFFRQAVARDGEDGGVWALDDIYLAHLALSDIAGGEFHHAERINRAGPGLAGVSAGENRIWNGNWSVEWDGDRQELEAIAEQFTLRLSLVSQKPPVIHGTDGISRKAAGEGRASHYISLTRLLTSGSLTLNGESFEVSGASWMDHEFFTNQLTNQQVGWDWMSIQLDNGAELMLAQLRRADGTRDPFSSGTYVDPQGRTTHLTAEDFTMKPGSTWKNYPVEWNVSVPSLNLELHATTPLDNQELMSKSRFTPTYWEGAMDFRGTHRGVGYLEMTGYGEEPALNAVPNQ